MFIGQQVYHSIYGVGTVLVVDNQALVQFNTEHQDLFSKGNGPKVYAWLAKNSFKPLDSMLDRYFEYVSRIGFIESKPDSELSATDEEILAITKPNEKDWVCPYPDYDTTIGIFGEDTDGGDGVIVQPYRPPLPKRADDGSAGYDIYALENFTIYPHKFTDIIKFGIKAYMPKNEFLSIHIRSSLGIKHGIVLANSVGIIDSSYVNNEDNEGEICARFYNHSEEAYTVHRGDRVIQGIFQEYKTIVKDEVLSKSRLGGIGSSKV